MDDMILAALCALVLAQDRGYPPDLPGAKVEVYKKTGDLELRAWIYSPEGLKAGDRRPAVVFFFGGGWTSGTPAQFDPQCRYLASRGMVAVTADYRVASRHHVKAVSCVADAKSAVRWIRANAARLGVDPDRIAAGGGSAGGHLAACTGVVEGFDEESEDRAVSSVPNAMLLFNPALVLAPVEGRPLDEKRLAGLGSRMGVDPVKLSPFHQVRKGAPPTLVLHGKADTTVPYVTAELFAEAMAKAGNRCELEGYDGETHGFFNHGRGGDRMYVATVRRMDVFLRSLGWLEGEPTLKE